MCDCGTTSSVITATTGINLIIQMLILGITSSFTHCIGMCGAIAVGQSTVRMIESSHKSSHLSKLLAAISWEYHFGKTLSYMMLTIAGIVLGKTFRSNPSIALVKNLLLVSVMAYFVFSAIRVLYKTFIIKESYTKQCSKIPFAPKIQSKIISRIIVGVMLGFIPCGMVYSAIISIVNSVDQFSTAMVAAIAFGLGTFPGLFLVAYSGNLFLYRFGNTLNIIYALVLIWNSVTLYQLI